MHAREVIELMGAYPEREFKMAEIINYVRNGRNLAPKQRRAMHVAVYRVLRHLEGSQSIAVVRSPRSASYRWLTIT